VGLFSELYPARGAETPLTDTFGLRAQDKHLSPKLLIKLRGNKKRKMSAHQPQLINGVLLFRQISMLPS